MTIADRAKKFEQLYQLDMSHKMEVLEGVLAYRLSKKNKSIRKKTPAGQGHCLWDET